jgi:glucose/arabinose dehydrogenase
VTNVGAPPAITPQSAGLTQPFGWSCDDFPCAEDIAGFMQRIQVPAGFVVEPMGRFPGQLLQITNGPDGRVYGTVLENGSRTGAVYALKPDGTTERYSSDLISPLGLAFQPGTSVLYVSARTSLTQGGALYRIPPGGGIAEPILTNLPCCYSPIENQPNGLTFGPDGYLYLGVGALTDQAESPQPQTQAFATLQPNEAAILRIQPHTGEVTTYAEGIRNPYDLTFSPDGTLYTSDNGLLEGPGDRLLNVTPGGFYGWPFWLGRGCQRCPLPSANNREVLPDWFTFPDFTLPRGLTVYSGTQFPANYFGNLFVTLWNNLPSAQRIVRLDPLDPRLAWDDFEPEAFMTGLIRPTDVIVALDGSLVVGDFVYGHVWRVRYVGV